MERNLGTLSCLQMETPLFGADTSIVTSQGTKQQSVKISLLPREEKELERGREGIHSPSTGSTTALYAKITESSVSLGNVRK